ncbi:hypothetical protein PRUPE_1G302600 [Prunus persica]|uniref:Uncharacterized protein n=1 Tax=Prunus persica TaxID=3760 RepID=M5XKY1_PRUPE|nr:hypothetical protein PRUPE_1G302600 [Prunus persica]
MSLSMHWLAPYIEKPNSSWVGLLGGEACSNHPRCKCSMSSNLLKIDFIHFKKKFGLWIGTMSILHIGHVKCSFRMRLIRGTWLSLPPLFYSQGSRCDQTFLDHSLTHALRNYCENQPLPKAINC